MFYDISVLSIWLGLAFLLGVVVGWMTETAGPQGPWFVGWFRWALVAFVVGVIVAWLYVLPGRAGFWLELALLYFASYIIGCLFGGFLQSLRAPMSEPALAVPMAAPAPPASAAPPAPAPQPVAQPVAASPASAPAVPAAAPETEPTLMGPVEGEQSHEGQRPVGWTSPRGGLPDDLKRIKGVGPQNEGRLHALGIWHFSQIAAWTHENALWVGSYLAFPGRIEREQWIDQARLLAQGKETEFSLRVERGEVAKSHDGGTHGQDNVADLSEIKPHK